MKNRALLLLLLSVIFTGSLSSVSGQAPISPIPNALNFTIPTVNIPAVPNFTVPTPQPVVIPTRVPIKFPDPTGPDLSGIRDPLMPDHKLPDIQPSIKEVPEFPTAVPLKQPDIPFGGKPAAAIDLSVFTHVTEATPVPKEGKEGYDEAVEFFSEGRYYSAWKAFTDSKYGDWQEQAGRCPQDPPETGELWHDPDQWLQDTELTIEVSQPQKTDMFLRIYKEDSRISNIYISGPGRVTVFLPGNAVYRIKDGIGEIWYGEKEAFGRAGTYETLIFDENGSESVFLRSGYSYTLSINVSEIKEDRRTDVDNRPESWENFRE